VNARVASDRKIKSVVLTRSATGNAELARNLSASGFKVVPIETIKFLPPKDWSKVDASLRGLGEFDWLLFTSATGVGFFARRMKNLSLTIPWDGKPAVAAVGEKTSAALREEGIEAGFVPSRFLTKTLAEQLPKGRGSNVLILRAETGSPEALAALERRGFRPLDLAIYRTMAVAAGQDVSARSGLSEADAILFASPSAVDGFMDMLDGGPVDATHARPLAVCIGPVTASAARRRGFERVVTARTHTIEGLVRSLRNAASGEGE
jgi:uroporphyrinogen III methyltransferase / synthase